MFDPCSFCLTALATTTTVASPACGLCRALTARERVAGWLRAVRERNGR